MQLSEQIKHIRWSGILCFYVVVLAGTYLARKLPNLLQLILTQITDIPFNFNFNHGIVTLAGALLFYRYSGVSQQITLLGNKKRKSLLFPLVLFTCYTITGIANPHNIDPHLWALLLCSFALMYNIMEEYAWRAYLPDSMAPLPFIFKGILSGVCWGIWHLLVFSNFDQYGGFGIFLLFCIVFSLLLTFTVLRTQAVIAAAAIHTFIIQMNIAALVCLLLFTLLLLTWNKPLFRPNAGQHG